MKTKKVIFIVGPTAIGKTSLSIKINNLSCNKINMNNWNFNKSKSKM